MIGEEVPFRRRVTKAIPITVLNVVLWIVIPLFISAYISSVLSQSLPSFALTNPTFIYTFGATITGLQALGTLTEGMAISVPFISGSYVASAFYIWEAVGGGTLSLTVSGISLALSFRLLIFLAMLPPLFNAARVPLVFLLEQSEAAREAKEVP